MAALLRIVVGDWTRVTAARCAAARALLARQLPLVLEQAAAGCAAALSAAAPVGKAENASPPPPGDADGPLSASFVPTVEMFDAAAGRAVVYTTQPTKLSFVTEGTGIYGPAGAPIRPTTKKALFWPDAPHPMRQVAGQRPNDFVSPVVASAIEAGVESLDDLAIKIADILNGEGGAP